MTGGVVGVRQDKRLGTRFEPSGCLHIVFYGAKGVCDGAVASFGRLKRLILLGWGGWQSWAGIVPDRFEGIEAAGVLPVPGRGARRGACAVKPRGSAPLALRSGALTAHPRPGRGLGSARSAISSTKAALSIYSAASAVWLAWRAVSIICMTKRCCDRGRRWMRSTCCKSFGAGPRRAGCPSPPIRSSTPMASA